MRERCFVRLDGIVSLVSVRSSMVVMFGISGSTRGRKSKVRGETCDSSS
jgi:hypothetical protein